MFFESELAPYVDEFASLAAYVDARGGSAQTRRAVAPNGLPYWRTVYTTADSSRYETVSPTSDADAEFRMLLSMLVLDAASRVPSNADESWDD
jgi:hypothetical protein